MMYQQQLPQGRTPQLPAGYQQGGLPLVANVSCVLPESEELGGLFIGNFMGAQNVELLKERGIRAVLTTSVETPIVYQGDHIPFHMRIEAHDRQNFSIGEHFEDCLEFIERCRRVTNVYVHCYAGVSRSASIVLAYIMKTHKWPYETALRFLRHKRSIVNPNEGFAVQLREFEKRLGLEPAPKLSAVQSFERPMPTPLPSTAQVMPTEQPSAGLMMFQKTMPQPFTGSSKDLATTFIHNQSGLVQLNGNGLNGASSMNRLPPLPKALSQANMIRSPDRQEAKVLNWNTSSREVINLTQPESERIRTRQESAHNNPNKDPAASRNIQQYEGQPISIPNGRPSFSAGNPAPMLKRQLQATNCYAQQPETKEKETTKETPKSQNLNNTVSDRKISVRDELLSQKISVARKERGNTANKLSSESPANSTVTSLRTLDDTLKTGPPGVRPKDLPGYRPPTVPSRQEK